MKFIKLKKDKYFLVEDFEKEIANSGLINYLTELKQREFVLIFRQMFKLKEFLRDWASYQKTQAMMN